MASTRGDQETAAYKYWARCIDCAMVGVRDGDCEYCKPYVGAGSCPKCVVVFDAVTHTDLERHGFLQQDSLMGNCVSCYRWGVCGGWCSECDAAIRWMRPSGCAADAVLNSEFVAKFLGDHGEDWSCKEKEMTGEDDFEMVVDACEWTAPDSSARSQVLQAIVDAVPNIEDGSPTYFLNRYWGVFWEIKEEWKEEWNALHGAVESG